MTKMALKRHRSMRKDLSSGVNRLHYGLEVRSRWFEYGHSDQYLHGATFPLLLFYFLKNPANKEWPIQSGRAILHSICDAIYGMDNGR